MHKDPKVTDERIRTWALFIAGLSFMAKFVFWTPTAINPLLTFLISGCIFGKAVLNLWKGGGE